MMYIGDKTQLASLECSECGHTPTRFAVDLAVPEPVVAIVLCDDCVEALVELIKEDPNG